MAWMRTVAAEWNSQNGKKICRQTLEAGGNPIISMVEALAKQTATRMRKSLSRHRYILRKASSPKLRVCRLMKYMPEKSDTSEKICTSTGRFGEVWLRRMVYWRVVKIS